MSDVESSGSSARTGLAVVRPRDELARGRLEFREVEVELVEVREVDA